MSQPHVQASREALRARLSLERQEQSQSHSPGGLVYEKTHAYWTALQKHGCGAPIDTTGPDHSVDTSPSMYAPTALQLQFDTARRGHDPRLSCPGNLQLGYDRGGKAFVQ